MSRWKKVHWYVGAISVAGIALFGTLVFTASDVLDGFARPRAWMFAVFILLGELFPISVSRRHEVEQVTLSTTFSFALLMVSGLWAAVAAQTIGSLVADATARKQPWKILFNISQFALSLAAGSAVLTWLTGPADIWAARHFTAFDLPGIAVAAAVYFLVNNVLSGTALALAERQPVIPFLRHDIAFQAATAAVLLSLSPIVVAAAEFSRALIPLFAIPLGAVLFAGRQAIKSEHQALHDALTDLPNRGLFHDRLEQTMLTAKREGGKVGVLLMDLDRFKEINDTLGHHLGDTLLKQVGPRLQGVLRESDTISRFGGDEFAVLLPKIQSPAAAAHVAEKILQAFEIPFVVDEMTLAIECSIGIAMYPDDGADPDGLIRRADVAMYGAKSHKTGYEIYSSARDEHSPRRLMLMAQLRRALETGEIISLYQPKADLTSGRITGVEALARWNHPELGLLPPSDFIPLAEHTGLIKHLTLRILDESLQQWRRWRDLGLELSMAVNLSAQNLLDPKLSEEIMRLIAKWGVPPGMLELEITESSIMTDPTRALTTLKRLDDMGLGLAIDDFGTGYSSLAYLKELPVDTLKIDRSFVANMTNNENDGVIVRSTIDLGHNLGMRVVAEGVETAEIWSRLTDLKCDIAQGFHLSKPVPADDLTRRLLMENSPAEKFALPLQ